MELIKKAFAINGSIIEIVKDGKFFRVGDRWAWFYKSENFNDADLFFNVAQFLEHDIFKVKMLIASEIRDAKKLQFPRFGDNRRIHIVERVDKRASELRPFNCGDVTQCRTSV